MSKINKTNIDNLRPYIGVPLTFKKVCENAKLPYDSFKTGSAKITFLKELLLWCDYEKSLSPTRYIVTEIYEEKRPKVPIIIPQPNDLAKYEEAKQFFIDRKITPVGDLPYPLRKQTLVTYICPHHPNETISTTWSSLKASIGCPLCKYPYSRFEVMVYLGIADSQHRVKFNGVEFDIYIPSMNTVVEIDGIYYHSEDTEEYKQRKIQAAKSNNLKFLRIEEILDPEQIRIEGKTFYVTPYSNANKIERKKIIKLLSQFLPFKPTKNIWNDAAIYMRENQVRQNPILFKLSDTIEQRDPQGNLIHSCSVRDLVNKMLLEDGFLGYNWSVTKTIK